MKNDIAIAGSSRITVTGLARLIEEFFASDAKHRDAVNSMDLRLRASIQRVADTLARRDEAVMKLRSASIQVLSGQVLIDFED